MASSSAPDLMVADADVLECGVCCDPLKPPIFQCAKGHVLCSRCADKLRVSGKCYLCGVTMPGGYQRCHAMESVVESVRSPCQNAPYGCEARPVFYARQEHVRECVHAPCHCPGAAGEAACGFKGSIPALLHHIVSEHRWPCTTARYGALFSNVRLRDGFNFFVSRDDVVDEHGRRYLYLFNVVRNSICRAVSVIRICPRVPADKGVKLVFSYNLVNEQLFSHEQKTEIKVAYSDLSCSDGWPDTGNSYQITVPNYVLKDDDDDMIVGVRQIFPGNPRYDSWH